jgi:hypothetical protein
LSNLLFTYRADLFGTRRSSPVITKGSRAWIEQYIPLEEFPKLFGGYILWDEPEAQTMEMAGAALGVWGKRNASKLRRILRERGAVFDVVEGEGPSQHLAMRSQHWVIPSKGARERQKQPN